MYDLSNAPLILFPGLFPLPPMQLLSLPPVCPAKPLLSWILSSDAKLFSTHLNLHTHTHYFYVTKTLHLLVGVKGRRRDNLNIPPYLCVPTGGQQGSSLSGELSCFQGQSFYRRLTSDYLKQSISGIEFRSCLQLCPTLQHTRLRLISPEFAQTHVH